MIRAKLAKRPGAPRNTGRMVHEWTRMNTNQTHSYLISFVWIRVHSWMNRLSFSSLAFLISWRAWRKIRVPQNRNLPNEPNRQIGR